MTLRPIEWEVRLPLSGEVVAIVRALELGRRREHYFRAVMANPDRAQRKLIGYWDSPQDAHDGVLALYELASGHSTAGGGRKPSLTPVPQKPPPVDVEGVGMASRPRAHATRR